MARNKLSDLRDVLFETLERLRDEENPLDIERAKAINLTAQTLISSAKVEVDMVRAIGASRPANGFFVIESESRELPRIPAAGAAPIPPATRQ